METGLSQCLAAIGQMTAEDALDLRNYSPLTLAYIGDAVYELMIRSMVISRGNAPVNKLHKRSAALAKAPAQAWIIKAIEPMLDEEELQVFKRGRNAKADTSAKNASIIDYRMATGFEALIGYLYLQKKYERLTEIVKTGIEKYSEEFKH